MLKPNSKSEKIKNSSLSNSYIQVYTHHIPRFSLKENNYIDIENVLWEKSYLV